MRINSLLAKIEDEEFEDVLADPKSLSHAIHLLRSDHSVYQLTFLTKNSERSMNVLIDYINELIDTELDHSYNEISAWDSTIAAILLSIIDTELPAAYDLSMRLANHPNLYWAGMIAQSYLLQRELIDD